METILKLNSINENVKENLKAISEPKNEILSRLKDLVSGSKENNLMCSYSRMHNRHNRS